MAHKLCVENAIEWKLRKMFPREEKFNQYAFVGEAPQVLSSMLQVAEIQESRRRM